MNAVTTVTAEREEKRRARRTGPHEPRLHTFTCKHLRPTDDSVSDNRLRFKGFLSFIDAFVDPLAGTEYMICSGAALPRSTADYFEQVGKHMAVVMYTPGGNLVAGPERPIAKRR